MPGLPEKYWDRLLTCATPALMLGAAGLASIAGGGGQQYKGLMLAGAAIFLLTGAATGLLAQFLPRWLQTLVLGITLVVSLDIAFGWTELVILLVRGWLPEAQSLRRLLILLIAFGAPLAFVCSLRSRAKQVLLAASLALALSSLFLPAGDLPGIKPLIARQVPPVPLGRVVIHILLDAHIGPSGIPDNTPGGPAMKRALTDFYTSHGFRIYSSAYSPYPTTVLSLPAFFDLDDPAPSTVTREQLVKRWGRPFNWFEQLRKEGYSTYAYTIGNAVDLCSSAMRGSFAGCERYDGDGLNLDLWREHPLRRIMVYIGRRSVIVQRLCALEPGCSGVYWVDLGRNLRSVQVLDAVLDTVKAASGDTAIFAHILLPHSPQLLGPDCRPALPLPYGEISPPQFFQRYFGQVKCTEAYIDRIERVLEARGALQNATIIVHGDHGIGPYQQGIDNPVWRTTWHSTLFAVKAPGVAPGSDDGFYRAQGLLKAFATGKPPAPGDGSVWDIDLGGAPALAHIDRAQLVPPR